MFCWLGLELCHSVFVCSDPEVSYWVVLFFPSFSIFVVWHCGYTADVIYNRFTLNTNPWCLQGYEHTIAECVNSAVCVCVFLCEFVREKCKNKWFSGLGCHVAGQILQEGSVMVTLHFSPTDHRLCSTDSNRGPAVMRERFWSIAEPSVLHIIMPDRAHYLLACLCVYVCP